MKSLFVWRVICLSAAVMIGFVAGCGNGADEPKVEQENGASQAAARQPAGNRQPGTTPPAQLLTADTGQSGGPKPTGPPKREFKPVVVGDGQVGSRQNATGTPGGAVNVADVFAAIEPLNILIGQWNTTTRTKGAGEAEWIIDPKTARTQPALTMSAQGHPYFQQARLTFDTAKKRFRMTAKDTEGNQRTYEGDYVNKPELVPGDNGKLQRQFKLKLDEVGNDDARKLVAVVFNQQENNRLLMEVHRRVGNRVQIQDTVANQRKNTSFALSDSDYGERECIVSQGLGTMAITYMGRTYYVCCSGCDAAFKDNPEFWIQAALEREKKAADQPK